MLLPLSITLIIFFCYFLLLFLYFLGLLFLRAPGESESDPKTELSVVIPFRNEATHLPGMIADLRAQIYPAHLLSVILVNDHSTDGSERLVASLVEDSPGYTFLDLPHGKQGKKEAIALALSHVTTPWVIQCDADCRLGPRFISSHISFLEKKPSDLVAGMVTSAGRRGGFLEVFERLDLLALNGSGAGSFALGRPILCSGANLLYSKKLYQDTRSFDPTDLTGSGDDMFLLIGGRKLKRRLAFNPDPDCLVQTAPVEDLASLIGQRVRWGGKSAYYRMADIQLVAVLVVAANLLMLLAPLWMLKQPEYCQWLLPGMGLKLMADFLILALASSKTRQTKILWWYLPVSVVYPLYLAVVILALLLGRTTWKGR